MGDERLGSDVATLREDLAALRNDLQTLRTYGEDRLVVPNAERDDPGAELNRRVVFVVESPTAARAITLLDGQGG